MSENKINRIKEYYKENIKENKKDKLQFYEQIKNDLLFFVSKKGVEDGNNRYMENRKKIR